MHANDFELNKIILYAKFKHLKVRVWYKFSVSIVFFKIIFYFNA